MDTVLDPVLFDLMSPNSIYAQKAQLVTLKWREIVSIGRATALWAWLCLSGTPPPDTLRATWLLQAIAAAQNLQPSDLVRYLDTLHLVVQNFDSVNFCPWHFSSCISSSAFVHPGSDSPRKIWSSCDGCSFSGLEAPIWFQVGCGYVCTFWD
jgi:hypothetical protein